MIHAFKELKTNKQKNKWSLTVENYKTKRLK